MSKCDNQYFKDIFNTKKPERLFEISGDPPQDEAI